MNGWIKIHRKIIEWQHFRNPYALQLFLFLVCSANIEDDIVDGVEVKRGQLLIGVPEISLKTGIPERKIRYLLKIVTFSSEICQEIVRKKRLITICKFEDYQLNLEVDCQNSVTFVSNSCHNSKKKKKVSPIPPLKENKESLEEEKKIKEKNKIDFIFKEVETRREEFKMSIAPYVEIYGRDMCNEFFRYWSEPFVDNPNKMRFEDQKTWSIAGRLATWQNKKWKK